MGRYLSIELYPTSIPESDFKRVDRLELVFEKNYAVWSGSHVNVDALIEDLLYSNTDFSLFVFHDIKNLSTATDI